MWTGRWPNPGPFVFTDYLELVDWTGRIVRDDKRGSIPADTPPILQRLHIESQAWMQLTAEFEKQFCHFVGRPEAVQRVCSQLGQKWAWGTSRCRAMFSP